jgi:hypothetical protein
MRVVHVCLVLVPIPWAPPRENWHLTPTSCFQHGLLRCLAVDSPLLTFPLLQIRLVTTPNASADTIRLWLERSGSRIPLDVEIYLQVPEAVASTPISRSRTRSPSQWPTFLSNNATTTTHYVQIQASQPTTSIQIVPSTPPIIIPHSPPHYDWSGSLSPPHPPPPHPSALSVTNQSRASTHWGHIVIFYLVEQMRRWERFVFRFERQFPSWQALKSISGAFVGFCSSDPII